MRSLRILPVTVIAMILVFGLKVSNFWTDAQGLILGLEVGEVQAQAQEGAENREDTAENAEAVDATEPADTTENEETSSIDVTELSDSEIEVLQRLTERREKLDARKQELDMRDNLLQATEKRIDDKIAQLKKIEATIQDLLKKYDAQELKKLKSLVTIYEKMKPKDAARVFNTLDMKVLLDITGLMKESKLAAILGKMNGDRAQELTIELATRKQLPGSKEGKG